QGFERKALLLARSQGPREAIARPVARVLIGAGPRQGLAGGSFARQFFLLRRRERIVELLQRRPQQERCVPDGPKAVHHSLEGIAGAGADSTSAAIDRLAQRGSKLIEFRLLSGRGHDDLAG